MLSGPIAVRGELEALGIQPNEEACEETISTFRFREGRYVVSLPWKQFHQPLPDNYCVSQQKLKGLLRRLRQNRVLLQDYNRISQEQIEKGIAEDAPNVEGNSTRMHYLQEIHSTLLGCSQTT